MIQDIPSSQEFLDAGKAQFDFAWDIVITFLEKIDEATRLGFGEEHLDFWEAAKQRILTALAITQQGVELILKGKIVEVSPYLLIFGNPSNWPKIPNNGQLSFSEFRTIDAQDLVKTFNIFSSTSLTQGFIDQFDDLRKFRNQIMHTVDRNLKVTAMEVIVRILEMHAFLIPNENWVDTRRGFLENSPTSILYSSEGIDVQLVAEFYIVFKELGRKQVKKFFNVEKNNREYFCPFCFDASEDYLKDMPKMAFLEPNTPESESLYCFICQKTHAVIRGDCVSNDCYGNVISQASYRCCTCGENQGWPSS